MASLRKRPARKVRKKQKDPFAQEVGARLVAGREAAGFELQTQFAARLKISAARLSNYENGWHPIPAYILIRIYAIAKITPDYLFLNDPTRLPGDIRDALAKMEAETA